MPSSVYMTCTRLCFVCVVGIGLCLFIVYGVLSAVHVDEASGAERYNSDSTGAQRKAGMKSAYEEVPGENFQHLHWFVQISDLHLSRFHDKARISDFRRFCEELGLVIAPEVVLVTGDITDAKHENNEGSEQYEDEWKSYNEALRQSGILQKTVWLDTRGNHDAFDVPYLTSKENYYWTYGVRGKQLSYMYLHNTTDNDVFAFIAIDACPNPGPKRPFNFFGILYQTEMDRLLGFINSSRHANHVIFFGHYPSSTITGTSLTEIRQLLGHGSVYLCGHFHTIGGLLPDMYARQKTGYLELELGDWKANRVYRLLAVDHDVVSFIDVSLDSWPVVLVTNPKNAMFHIPGHESTSNIYHSTHIRILAFSTAEIVQVEVKIDGAVSGSASRVHGPLFVLPWDPKRYEKGLHTIEVIVRDSAGREATALNSFSVDGTQLPFKLLQRLALVLDHSVSVKLIFSLCLVLSLAPLVVFRFCQIHLHINTQSRTMGCFLRFLQCWIRRMFLLCSTPSLFYPILFHNLYVLIGPWFIGEILNGRYGACFVFGFVLSDAYLPTTVPYMYGALQILMFNIPLMFYVGRCLDLASSSQHRRDCGQQRRWPLVWLLDHGVFLLLIGSQAYFVWTGFRRAHGLLALFFCPLRTWAILLAIFLRYQALKDGTKLSSCSGRTESTAAVVS